MFNCQRWVVPEGQTLQASFLRFFHSLTVRILQVLDYAPLGFGRQSAAWQIAGSLLQAQCGHMEKRQLLEIAIAPDADQEMQPHLYPQAKWQRLFQRLRREPGHVRAVGRETPNPRDAALFRWLEDFHSGRSFFSNQFVSMQRRNAMRARCSITQRLLSEMFSRAQISLLSMPSTSRKVNTVPTFFGSLFEQSRKVCQNTSLSRLAPGLDHSCGPSS